MMVKELHRPTSLDEALRLLSSEGARPLAGGTTLLLSLGAQALVDISRCGLDGIEVGDQAIQVGAMVTCAAVVRALRQHPSAFSDAASLVGSRVLRNHVTVGGNSVMVYAWSDLPVALLAMGASFELATLAGRRTLSADQFYAAHPTRVLAKGELLVSVSIPRLGAGEGSAFVKFARNVGDHASASVAASLAMDSSTVRSARLVAGGVKGMPQLLGKAAASLVGRPLDDAVLQEMAELARTDVDAIADFRGGKDWRRHLVGVLAMDAVRLAATRVRGEAS